MYYVTQVIFSEGNWPNAVSNITRLVGTVSENSLECEASDLGTAISVLNRDIENNKHKGIKSAEIFKMVNNEKTLVVKMRAFL